MNFGKKIGEPKHGFPLTSMIDLLFILLIFFMTASMYAQLEAELNVQLPVATKGQDIEREPHEIIINVMKDGNYFVFRTERTEEEINQMLQRLAGVYRGERIIVRADQETAWRNVVRVLDACKKADIWNVSFAVLPSGEVAGE